MTVSRVAVATALLAVASFAQDAGGVDYEVNFPDELQEALSITDEQVYQLRANQALMRVELQPIARKHGELARQIRQESRAEVPNEFTIGTLTLQLEVVDHDMAQVRSKYQGLAKGILTEEQRMALAPIEEAAAYTYVLRQAASFSLVTLPERDTGREGRSSGRNQGRNAPRTGQGQR